MSKGSTDLLLGDKTSNNTNPFQSYILSPTQTSTFTTDITTSSTTDATAVGVGSIVTSGGISVASQIRVNGTLTSSATTDSTSTATGAIQTLGGLGVAKSITSGGKLIYTGKTSFTSVTSFDIPVSSILTTEGSSMTVRVYFKSSGTCNVSASDEGNSLTSRLSSYLDQATATLVNTANTDSLTGAKALTTGPHHLIINILSNNSIVTVDISGNVCFAGPIVSHFHWTAHGTEIVALRLESSVASSLTGFYVIERLTK